MANGRPDNRAFWGKCGALSTLSISKVHCEAEGEAFLVLKSIWVDKERVLFSHKTSLSPLQHSFIHPKAWTADCTTSSFFISQISSLASFLSPDRTRLAEYKKTKTLSRNRERERERERERAGGRERLLAYRISRLACSGDLRLFSLPCLPRYHGERGKHRTENIEYRVLVQCSA